MHAEALNDGDASAHVLAPAVGGVVGAPVAGDELVVGDVAGVEAVDGTLVDGAPCVAPSSELVEARMNRLPGGGPALKGEHSPEPPVFPGWMELHLPVEFPQPLAPARRMVVVPRMAASMATKSLAGPSHPHRSGVLEIVGCCAPSLHWTNWLERWRRYLPDPFRRRTCQGMLDY